jgi:hypothetical protein
MAQQLSRRRAQTNPGDPTILIVSHNEEESTQKTLSHRGNKGRPRVSPVSGARDTLRTMHCPFYRASGLGLFHKDLIERGCGKKRVGVVF